MTSSGTGVNQVHRKSSSDFYLSHLYRNLLPRFFAVLNQKSNSVLFLKSVNSSEEFDRKYKAHLPVEEYELEFIDGSEFEGFLAKYFFKESNDVEKFFELIEKHERSITAENIVALEYLIEYEHCDVENAFDKLEDVTIFEGTAEDYAIENYEHEIQEKLGTLAYYFDYKDLGKDLVLGGDISEYERNYKKYIITP